MDTPLSGFSAPENLLPAGIAANKLMTNLENWRLEGTRGQQVWNYYENNAPPRRALDIHHLSNTPDITTDSSYKAQASTPEDSLYRGIHYLSKVQAPSGHWGGDYGGPMFLLPGLIITCYITDTPLTKYQKIEMVRYLVNLQNDDGGWGLHIEGPSTMFGTALNYVALRLLGIPPEDSIAKKGRKWIQKFGGAVHTPSWGKVWLATLGCYDWTGVNPVPPELFLLPTIIPLSPGNMWCHSRVVYLPMAWLYGSRSTAKLTPLVSQLRNELYIDPYNNIVWSKYRASIHPKDLYRPVTKICDLLFSAFYAAENIPVPFVRSFALAKLLDHIQYEDRHTNHICIGPVNKVLNFLCNFFSNPKSPNIRKHQNRINDYLWLAEDGLKMQGYNGSQSWDTSFALSALCEYPPISKKFPQMLKQGFHFLNVTQVDRDCPNLTTYYRHISKGAWPFSTYDHGWPISDCTSEGLMASLHLQDMFTDEIQKDSNGETIYLEYPGPTPDDFKQLKPQSSIFSEPPAQLKVITPLAPQRYADAANVLISLQNVRYDNGWATYENKRAGDFFELFNPSGVFGDIMVDYSYVECSSACIRALGVYLDHFPNSPRALEIKKSREKGLAFIKSIQQNNGSWKGSWGVCFTYGTWFGIEALASFGETYENSPAMKRACDYLVSKQMNVGQAYPKNDPGGTPPTHSSKPLSSGSFVASPRGVVSQKDDGGWGETFNSCVTEKWCQNAQSQVVNTGWALLSLMAARYPVKSVIDRGIQNLMRYQQLNGNWLQQDISGVFNANCSISYSNYKHIFPIWALSRYLKIYGNHPVSSSS